MSEPSRFESRLLDDGTFVTTLRSGSRSCDVGPALLRDLHWNATRETPLDALLQSGRFAEILPTLLREAREGAPAPRGRQVAPLVRPGKILALGRTYREHALELGNAPPSEPIVFEKLPETLAGDEAEVAIPERAGGRMDHEAELALVVGSRASALPKGNGRRAIVGVTIANDLTLRSVQKAAQKAGHPWLFSKNFPGSCVLGPWMTAVGPEENLDDLAITCRVNRAVRQHARTSSLMLPVGELVERVSQWMTLSPGDVILTGTPAGTGPLAPGDVCEITIAGTELELGTLVTKVR